MKIRKFLGAALAALLSTSALAQVNVVPQMGVISALITRDTYSAATLGLVVSTGATDVACISGSPARAVHINHISINGVSTTATIIPVIFYKRVLADTGGTTASGSANWANTITAHDVNNPTPGATLVAYTGNPTINDTGSRIFRVRSVSFPTTSSVVVSQPTTLDWTSTSFAERPVLRGVSEQLCVNFNAGVLAAPLVVHLAVEWTEE